MKNIKFISGLLVLLMGIVSCEKDKPMIDTGIPTISILSPSTNRFMDGDTIQIHAEIADNDQLHDIAAKIERTHNGVTEEVWNMEMHVHADSFDLLESYVVESVGMHNDFKLTFTVSDHNGNIGTKEFLFHVM